MEINECEHGITPAASCMICNLRMDLELVRRERDAYRDALKRIASIDYRGNRSQESEIAFGALLRNGTKQTMERL